MKLLTSVGPNPHFVRLFMAEKGIEITQENIDIIAGENRLPAFLAINPSGATPVLILDDGIAIAETVAICEYLEEMYPQQPLLGRTAQERAVTRMWTRRVELGVVQPMTAGFRAAEGLPLFKDRVRCLPQAATDLKLAASEGLAFINKQMGGKAFLAGDSLTMADLLLFAFIEFGALVGQGLDPANSNLVAWRERMSSRASVALCA
jgi:glutathione S-transferase